MLVFNYTNSIIHSHSLYPIQIKPLNSQKISSLCKVAHKSFHNGLGMIFFSVVHINIAKKIMINYLVCQLTFFCLTVCNG